MPFIDSIKHNFNGGVEKCVWNFKLKLFYRTTRATHTHTHKWTLAQNMNNTDTYILYCIPIVSTAHLTMHTNAGTAYKRKKKTTVPFGYQMCSNRIIARPLMCFYISIRSDWRDRQDASDAERKKKWKRTKIIW